MKEENPLEEEEQNKNQQQETPELSDQERPIPTDWMRSMDEKDAEIDRLNQRCVDFVKERMELLCKQDRLTEAWSNSLSNFQRVFAKVGELAEKRADLKGENCRLRFEVLQLESRLKNVQVETTIPQPKICIDCQQLSKELSRTRSLLSDLSERFSVVSSKLDRLQLDRSDDLAELAVAKNKLAKMEENLKAVQMVNSKMKTANQRLRLCLLPADDKLQSMTTGRSHQEETKAVGLTLRRSKSVDDCSAF